MKCCVKGCPKEAKNEMHDKTQPYNDTYNYYCDEHTEECNDENSIVEKL